MGNPGGWAVDLMYTDRYQSGQRAAVSGRVGAEMDIAELHGVIAAALKQELSGIELTDDLELVESGIIDSFALTKIVAALETAYASLRVPDSDATVENLGSVDRIKAYLAGRN